MKPFLFYTLTIIFSCFSYALFAQNIVDHADDAAFSTCDCLEPLLKQEMNKKTYKIFKNIAETEDMEEILRIVDNLSEEEQDMFDEQFAAFEDDDKGAELEECFSVMELTLGLYEDADTQEKVMDMMIENMAANKNCVLTTALMKLVMAEDIMALEEEEYYLDESIRE